MLFRSQNAIKDIDKDALLKLVRALASIESYVESGSYSGDRTSIEEVVNEALEDNAILLRLDKIGDYQEPDDNQYKSDTPASLSECLMQLNADIDNYLSGLLKAPHETITLRVPCKKLNKMDGFKQLDKSFTAENQADADGSANHALTGLFIREIKSGEPYRKRDGVSFIKTFEKSEDPAGYLLKTMRDLSVKNTDNNAIELQDMSRKLDKK